MPAQNAESRSVADLVARLAVRSGLSLGGLYGGRRREFELLLAMAAASLAADREHDERGVNDALKAWLAGDGAMVAVDHVELRRWLVDAGLVGRDGFGRRYVRAANPPVPYDALLATLATIDVAATVANARAQDAQRREERRARHAASG